MLTSLALIFLVGLAMSAICKQIRLPGIIGMLATGIVLGPYVLDLLSPSILGISADLRKFGLIVDNNGTSLYEGLKTLLSSNTCLMHYKQKSQEKGRQFALKNLEQKVYEKL